jgi:hypothetical protein
MTIVMLIVEIAVRKGVFERVDRKIPVYMEKGAA